MSVDGSVPAWGTDVPISMPEPPAADAGDTVALGGLAFAPCGVVFDMSEVDREHLYAQAYAPPGGLDG